MKITKMNNPKKITDRSGQVVRKQGGVCVFRRNMLCLYQTKPCLFLWFTQESRHNFFHKISYYLSLQTFDKLF